MWMWARQTALTALLCAAALSACSTPETRRARGMMSDRIVPASDAIFNAVVYTNGQLASSPQTDQEWGRLDQHAQTLMTSASELTIFAPSENPDMWRQQSAAMGVAAQDARQAIAGRDLDGMLQVGSRLYETCTACHAAYVPPE